MIFSFYTSLNHGILFVFLLQVQGGKDGIKETLIKLIKEEGVLALWTKGLTARFLSAVPSGFFLSVSYELIKKLSMKNKDDYKSY